MKDLDFLPEWYKDRKRRHSLVRKQYMGLAAVFVMMMTFNLIAMHRAGRVAAGVACQEDQRVRAEAVVHEFNLITKELNRMKAKADLVRRIDTGIDIAAILAEISHIVDESVVLGKIELSAESFSQPDDKSRTKSPIIQAAGRTPGARPTAPLEKSKLRVTLAGVAAHPADVADLVCELDESSYFQQVRPSFYSKTTVRGGSPGSKPRQADTAGADATEMMTVTAFEITCYLANFIEVEER